MNAVPAVSAAWFPAAYEYVSSRSDSRCSRGGRRRPPFRPLHAPVAALLERRRPAAAMQQQGESTIEAAIRIARQMAGGCLVIQGPPGTGKTYTAARGHHCAAAAGKRVGVASNSHKAIMNLLMACGEAARASGMRRLQGIKVGGEADDSLFSDNRTCYNMSQTSADARAAYRRGVVGGTAWLFTVPSGKDAWIFSSSTKPGRFPWPMPWPWLAVREISSCLGIRCSSNNRCKASHPGDAGCPRCNTPQGHGRQPARCAAVPCRRASGRRAFPRRIPPHASIRLPLHLREHLRRPSRVASGLRSAADRRRRGNPALSPRTAASSSAASSTMGISSRATRKWHG